MKSWIKYSLLLLLLVSKLVIFGQVMPVIQADRDSILIGEQITLTLAISYDISQPHELEWPKIDSIIGQKLEVLKVMPTDTMIANKDEDPTIFVQSKNIVITSFDSGYFAIAPFQFKLNSKILRTKPLLITVTAPRVDILEDFIPVKPLIEVEMSFADYMKIYGKWILSFLVLILLVWLAYRYLKKRKEEAEKNTLATTKELVPPYELAMSQLSALKTKGLFKQGMVKEHYIQLTDILREYIESRFDINATDETTDEILNELRRINVHKKDRSTLSKVLQLADYVKFAKAKPSVLDTENALQNSFDFIERTKPKEEEASDEKE